ncbi:hypothetical protein BGZ82_000546 [Podila clonocystis]|nr:hypothetical protein BGZ82_000546 [Podila clonocystis]
MYEFKVFGIAFTDKIFMYVLGGQEYLDVLSTGGAPQGGTPRPPSEEQIATLQAMFPNTTQDQAVEALNSANNNMDGAVQFLLDRPLDEPRTPAP